MAGASLTASKSPTTETIKFLCSFDGRILPRYPDGKLRYHGGQTRVLAVARSVSFSELMIKLGELCGKTVSLRCQLPTEDLDALVRVTSDEDLANLIEEYDRIPCVQSSSVKIRAFLSTPKKRSPSPTPTPSTASVSGSGSSSSNGSPATSPKFPFYHNKSAGNLPCYAYRNFNRCCLVPNGNYWQHNSLYSKGGNYINNIDASNRGKTRVI